MHEHDLDLIAAYADGTLDDGAEARALVDGCDVCAAEYRSQRAVLEMMALAPAAEMTDLERASLRREVWAGLAQPSRAATPWWYRWSYVAAGLFVLIGLVAVLGGLGGGDDSGDLLTVAGDTADSDAPTEESATPLFGAESDGGGSERTSTTAAAAEGLAYPFADLAAEARAKRDGGDAAIEGLATEGEVDECLDALDLDDQELIEILDVDRRLLVLMPPKDTGEDTVTFVALEGCEIVHVDG